MIWGVLSGLGLGEQLFASGTLLVVAWYLLRMVSMAGTVGGVLSNGVTYLVVTAVVLALALGLGWFDPQMDAIQSSVSALRRGIQDIGVSLVEELLSEVDL